MTSFLPSPFSSQILPSTPHCFFQIHGLFSIHCYYMHVCMCTHTVCILLRLCVFRVDHLVLNNQLLCSSLEKTISPTLSTSQLSPALCRTEASEAFPAPALGCPLVSFGVIAIVQAVILVRLLWMYLLTLLRDTLFKGKKITFNELE